MRQSHRDTVVAVAFAVTLVAVLDLHHGPDVLAQGSSLALPAPGGRPAGAASLAPVAPPWAARRGVVRLTRGAFADDGGPFVARGTTLFWGLWAYRHDRARLEANLAFLAASGGVDYVRTFAQVGGRSWEDRAADPAWPDYDDVLRGYLDLVARYGMRTELTVFGSADLMTPARRAAFVDRVARTVRGREQRIMHFEIANEGLGTGFGHDGGIAEMRALTRRLQARTPSLVAVTAAFGKTCQVYGGGVARLATVHFDRDSGAAEGPWRPVLQPWTWPRAYACPGKLPPATNNEPIGPFSSVAEDRDPSRAVSAAIVSYVSGLPGYVLHTGPGIRGGGAADLSRTPPRPANLWETAGIASTLDGFKAMRTYLPRDLSGWQRQDTSRDGVPFKADLLWPDTNAAHGAVRVYAATRGPAVVAIAFGIRDYVVLTATRAVAGDVRRALDGAVVERFDLKAGQSVRLSGATSFVLIGRLKPPPPG